MGAFYDFIIKGEFAGAVGQSRGGGRRKMQFAFATGRRAP